MFLKTFKQVPALHTLEDGNYCSLKSLIVSAQLASLIDLNCTLIQPNHDVL